MMKQHRLIHSPEKTRFKLYKAKKQWVVAGMTLFSLGAVSLTQAETAHADTTSTTSKSGATTPASSAEKTVTLKPASSTSATASSTSSQSATTPTSSASSSAVSSSSTKKSTVASSSAAVKSASSVPQSESASSQTKSASSAGSSAQVKGTATTNHSTNSNSTTSGAFNPALTTPSSASEAPSSQAVTSPTKSAGNSSSASNSETNSVSNTKSISASSAGSSVAPQPVSQVNGVNSASSKGSTTAADKEIVKKTVTNRPKAADVASGQDGSVIWNIDSNNVLHFQAGTLNGDHSQWQKYKTTITQISIEGAVTLPPNSSYLFSGMTQLTAINGSTQLNSNNVTNMSNMFLSDSSLTSLDLSSFDTSNVTTMQSMFYGNSSLKTLNISNFNTSKVTDMSYMFFNPQTSSYTNLDVSSFDTSNVTTMQHMFENTTSLKSLNVSNFNTSKVTNMGQMFSGTGVTSLDLSNFDTSNVTNMHWMFYTAHNLKTVNVSSFNTSKVTDMTFMFNGDNSLTRLDISNFNMGNVPIGTGMLVECSGLRVLKLGANTRISDAGLPEPHVPGTLNQWRAVAGGTETAPQGNATYTSGQLMSLYNSSMADTYVLAVDNTVINGHDSTVIMGPNTPAWNAQDNFDGATDQYGNSIPLSNIKVTYTTGTPNVKVAGDYKVTYSYKDPAGNTITKTVTVHVVQSKANIYGHNSTIANGSAWSPQDNLDGATDMNGNAINPSLISSTNNVNPKVAGNYTVTYTYTDGVGNVITKSYTVTVSNSQANIYAHNSEIESGSTWSPEDNFDGATDANGNAVSFSNVTVSGSVDTSKAGEYQITYSFTDVSGNPVSKTITVTVGESQINIYAHNSQIPVGSTWSPEDNFDGATDVDGDPVDFSQITVNGSVDPKTAGTYTVTYTYTDANGNSVSKQITVTVANSRSNIYAHNSTLGIGSEWSSEDNFDGAVDANGNPVDFSDVTVTGDVDSSKAGTYNITYSFVDASGKTVTKTITVTILDSRSNIYAHNSEIANGSTWNPQDNFDGAVDENGNNVSYGNLTSTTIKDANGTILSTIDTTQAGTYYVTYSYTDSTGETVSKTVQVTVDETVDKGRITGHDSTIVAGPNGTWNPEDNLTAVYDENGNPVDLSSSDITVSGTVDPSTPGTYNVTYTYTDGRGIQHTTTVTVIVKGSLANIYGHDSTVSAGSTWNIADNFDGATDANGNQISLSNLTSVSGSVNTNVPGNYEITYTYVDSAGNTVTKTFTVTVLASKANIYGHDSQIANGSTWNAQDNFDGAIDAEGNPISFDDVTVSGSVNTSKAGQYQVTYSYQDATGKTITKTVTVTVGQSADKGSVTAHDSTLVAGPDTVWNAKDNFNGATDENGNPVDFAKVKVSGSVDTTKSGSYQVTYTYTDSRGETHSATIIVQVINSKANIFDHDSTIDAGSTWNAQDNFDGAIDENGNSVDFSKVKVSGDVNTAKAGNYDVTYTYTDAAGNVVTKTVTVTVKKPVVTPPTDDQTTISAHDSTLIAGPDTNWKASDNFTNATDANGNPIDFSKVKVSGVVNTGRPGDYQITYSYMDAFGKTVSKTITVHVIASQASVTGKNSTINSGSAWNPKDNFVGATDANGKPVSFDQVSVSGTVNSNVPGHYDIVYRYTDSQGNVVEDIVTVMVKEKSHTPGQSGNGNNVEPTIPTQPSQPNNHGDHPTGSSMDPSQSGQTSHDAHSNASQPMAHEVTKSSVNRTSPRVTARHERSTTTHQKVNQQTLPQTGERFNRAVEPIGLAVLGLVFVGLLGLGVDRKRDDEASND
ncbi:bacterial Ig-like domain-containing protein [Levilactobacillus bambusae]|uniref:Ig-like domain-containing protein n=1 Tax=Levilactobacillus bambusae TaxID=2024736 RepID=A0A2V1MZP9_9LACO|nr:bacterial Ig-like domain-containing protein [Levilactobacillus bambusae]PWG00459.1 hypothetical protein DCM90_05915 [Levilactobacillus bambusae]